MRSATSSALDSSCGFCRRGPRLLRIDLKEESRKLASQLASVDRSSDDVHLAYKEWSIRAYRLADVSAGRTVADFERCASPERVFVERIRRGISRRRAGDRSAIGRCHRHRGEAESAARWTLSLGEEVEDPALLEFPMATLDVVVTRRRVIEQPLSALAQQHGRGVVLVKLIRGGEEMLFGAETIINRETFSGSAAPGGTWNAPGRRWATSSAHPVSRMWCSSA